MSLLKITKKLNGLFIAVALLTISLVIGVSGYMLIEDYTFLEALFMSVITISTVGFTEVHLLSDVGMMFTSVYIIMNLIIFAYVVSVISKFLFEGKLRSIYNEYKFVKELTNMKNHVIVCGYGSNGMHSCEELQRNGRDFVIIDINEDTPKKFPEDKPFMFVHGDATHEETLIKAGVKTAKELLIATSSDAINVFITLSARELNPNIKIISRATDPASEKKLYFAGANNVILPDIIGGTFMARLITKPEVIEFMEMLSDDNNEMSIKLEEFSYKDFKNIYRDKTLGELDIQGKTGIFPVGFKDNIRGFIGVRNETIFGENDILIVLGNNDTMQKFRTTFLL